MIGGEARANEAYRIDIDGAEREGATDGDGVLDEPVPPQAIQATVRFSVEPAGEEEAEPYAFNADGEKTAGNVESTEVGDGHTAEDIYVFDLRHLDPSSEVTGAQGRLRSLGYQVGEIDGELGPRTADALRSFQEQTGLEVTGELDEATQAKLSEIIKG